MCHMDHVVGRPVSVRDLSTSRTAGIGGGMKDSGIKYCEYTNILPGCDTDMILTHYSPVMPYMVTWILVNNGPDWWDYGLLPLGTKP